MYFMVVSSLNLSACLNLFQISQRTMSGCMSERLRDACWPVKHGWAAELSQPSGVYLASWGPKSK